MTDHPILQASGTNLVVLRARARSETHGVFIPDSAQKASRWGKILSRGRLVDRVSPESTIVCFNPAMTMPGLEDSRGNVLFDIIDQEAVVVEGNDAAAEAANLVFDTKTLDDLLADLGASTVKT